MEVKSPEQRALLLSQTGPSSEAKGLARYELISQLGRGASGTVFLARSRTSQRLLVLKQISLFQGRARAQNENSLLEKMSHPSIVRSLGSFCEGGYQYIAMEYAEGGDLHAYVTELRKAKSKTPESRVWDIARQLFSALEYVHGRQVIHRDVKAPNIFISGDGSIRLGDFGVSKSLHQNLVSEKDNFTRIGTPLYLAPEIVQHKAYDYKIDVWAAGIVLYFLCTHRMPFQSENLLALGALIVQEQPLPIDGYSSDLVSLVNACLQKKPEDRLSASQALSLALNNGPPGQKKIIQADSNLFKSFTKSFINKKSSFLPAINPNEPIISQEPPTNAEKNSSNSEVEPPKQEDIPPVVKKQSSIILSKPAFLFRPLTAITHSSSSTLNKIQAVMRNREVDLSSQLRIKEVSSSKLNLQNHSFPTKEDEKKSFSQAKDALKENHIINMKRFLWEQPKEMFSVYTNENTDLNFAPSAQEFFKKRPLSSVAPINRLKSFRPFSGVPHAFA